MRCGMPFAFVIDLLDDDGERVAFRIHYQDAASDEQEGWPPQALVDARPVDLAVLCMPSSWKVKRYPKGCSRGPARVTP